MPIPGVIRLNFVNRSDDVNNSQIVVFQKNVAAASDSAAVAWTVVPDLAPGTSRPVEFPLEVAVAASDSFGNVLPARTAQPGDVFEMQPASSGHGLTQIDHGLAESGPFHVRNGLPLSSIDANVYRGGRLLAVATGIAPGRTASFQFGSTIVVGLAQGVQQGTVMDSAAVRSIGTELALLGLSAADIVMTGGGPGNTSTPITFTLENVKTV